MGIAGLSARGTVQDKSFQASGDADNLWIMTDQPSPDGSNQLSVLHRRYSDPSESIQLAQTLSGQLTPGGVASSSGRLWLVFQNNVVQRINFRTNPRDGRLDYALTRLPSLPGNQDSMLRSLVANSEGPWALLSIKGREAGKKIGNTLSLPAVDSELTVGKNEMEVFSSDRDPVGATLDQPVRTDRVVKFVGTGYVNVPLPEDWPVGEDVSSWLVMRRPQDHYPLLVASVGEEIQPWIWEHQQSDGSGWKRLPFPKYDGPGTISFKRSDLLVPTAIDGQLVLAQRQRVDNTRIELVLSVLRPQRIIRLGTLSLDRDQLQPWAVVGGGDRVMLVVQQHEQNETSWRWASMDLDGQIVQAPKPLVSQSLPVLAELIAFVLMVSVMVAAMVLLFVFWPRDPAKNQVLLPAGMELADLARRMFAGSMDLVVAVGVVAMVIRVAIMGIFDDWSLPPQAIDQLIPGALSIGLFVTYSLLSELFTARTLGKAMFGLRVTCLDGTTPKHWQIIVRNLLKAFDLIAYPLLLLPMLRPSRQRLGDLVARTIVVSIRNEIYKSGDKNAHDRQDDHKSE